MIQNKSWKTTTAGIILGVALAVGEVCDFLGIPAPNLGTDGVFQMNTLIAGVSALWFGFKARDNDKSSEQVGVR